MDELVKLLDKNLICTGTNILSNSIHFYVESTRKECTCPSCQTVSSRIHSRYIRIFQDLPIQDKKVMISLANRKMFCDNPLCDRTTFAESFSFIDNKAKKTKRLIEVIIEVSLTQSSVSAATYLTKHIVDVKKSSICNYQKKKNQ
jgi:transposase